MKNTKKSESSAMSGMWVSWCGLWWAACAVWMLGAACAQAALPKEWQEGLARINVPENAVAVAVQEVGAAKPLLTHRADALMNPASVMKLVTTTAALDLLGTEYRWKTEVYLDGTLTDGVLHGNLVLKGYGDPKLTIEQWQAFMQRLRQAGLKQVTGDLIVDRTLFSLPAHNPAGFDSSPLKPYNVGPDALLVSFKAVRLQISKPASKKEKQAEVLVEPPLPGIHVKAPLLSNKGCGDWWSTLKPQFADSGDQALVHFGGSYASRCGTREVYVALLDGPNFVHGMFTHYFAEAGGVFHGGVREGKVTTGKPWLTFDSVTLAEVVQDINKRSNNVMAQHVFLTLASLQTPPPYTRGAARLALAEWLKTNRIQMEGLYVDNGAGLSRDARVSAQSLVNLLMYAQQTSWRDVFIDSLPIAGVDGTLKYRFYKNAAYSVARLKTGHLEGVRALAGYVDTAAGKRYAIAIVLNHKNAEQGAAVMDAMVEWVYQHGATLSPQVAEVAAVKP